MPRYDYKCVANGHVFEVIQKFTDEPVAFCPEDGSRAERQISIPHVIYKGSGFYSTDYGNGKSAANSSSSSSNGSSSSESSSKSESDNSSSSSKASSGNSSSSSSSSSDSKS